jgi:hypothetical protein
MSACRANLWEGALTVHPDGEPVVWLWAHRQGPQPYVPVAQDQLTSRGLWALPEARPVRIAIAWPRSGYPGLLLVVDRWEGARLVDGKPTAEQVNILRAAATMTWREYRHRHAGVTLGAGHRSG